ncbi:hypothetical protein BKH46_02730 [Helicobacter sp. 12S02634-8]|uniref:DUF354 domain-containing protein n=1 Tax=Helicobacter sp. 12S02634-8 TaxID=1476199 RepID=UPI000BA72812|nr:DUF354 domain-containing protein [Helicobacter sp. 12S02634-8]PAF47771.1 hypothetical protein BKH46_02730 [Helicobacter sp. 12S02634-8]
MIWLDIIDPKYVLFFKNLIPQLKCLDTVLITTRESGDYSECKKLLELFGIEHICIGGYGGEGLLGKFEKRLERQEGFLKLFAKTGIPKLFITGASADGAQTAFALGIPVVHFSDTPIKADHFTPHHFTQLARLTLPLSSLVFYPFVLPEICFTTLGIERENLICYHFIDVALWLKDLYPSKDFREIYHIPKDKPVILVREEEYKAHYVSQKLPIIYESIALLSRELEASLVVMPRYGSEKLKNDFGRLSNVFIIEDKLEPSTFYPFIDVLIGGGGTMNLEACYLGIPTISTRSLFLFHDRFLLTHHLMCHCKDTQEVYNAVKNALDMSAKDLDKTRAKAYAKSLFEPEEACFDQIIQEIQKRYY